MDRLSEDQRDALQELMNVAMGQAADQLACLTDTFVVLSVPRIHSVASLRETQLPEVMGDETVVDVTRQSFLGQVRGEAFVCFGCHGADQLAELMGYDEHNIQQREELMLDVTNILSGACINSLAQQFDLPVSYGAPSVFSRHASFKQAMGDKALQSHRALVMEIRFEVQACRFTCDLLLCIAEDTVGSVLAVIDRLLSEL
ncbi:Chemotaxis protein CheC [Pseudomonas sp. 8Z]|uniref:chemotaxis protein CheC n=1 Tax=Pseudomonas sp. 8Z TaxID=2653166 RepID=UPI0012F205BE|nr:chemotaxis protein CheC [Pseudomonas sp. 8Z]VXC17431.1 Chemotaxis protein CheC [Pseudomonas sp. 8Z]